VALREEEKCSKRLPLPRLSQGRLILTRLLDMLNGRDEIRDEPGRIFRGWEVAETLHRLVFGAYKITGQPSPFDLTPPSTEASPEILSAVACDMPGVLLQSATVSAKRLTA